MNSTTKFFKAFLLICWTLSAVFMMMGLIVFTVDPTNINFNWPLSNLVIIVFSGVFTISFPLMFNMCFTNTYFKTEEEIEKLKDDLRLSKIKYDEASDKLIAKTLKEN